MVLKAWPVLAFLMQDHTLDTQTQSGMLCDQPWRKAVSETPHSPTPWPSVGMLLSMFVCFLLVLLKLLCNVSFFLLVWLEIPSYPFLSFTGYFSCSSNSEFYFSHRAEKTEVLSEDLLQVTKYIFFLTRITSQVSCMHACWASALALSYTTSYCHL